MKLFLAMLQFMTRIPVPESWTKDLDFNRSVEGIIWFPLVGFVVGAVATAVYSVALLWSDVYLASACYVLALALITGAFHLDGLADTCDGIFSARKRERMLEIMRDSRLGTNGGLALIFIILFRVLAVAHLASVSQALTPFLLWAAPVARQRAETALIAILRNISVSSFLSLGRSAVVGLEVFLDRCRLRQRLGFTLFTGAKYGFGSGFFRRNVKTLRIITAKTG